MKIFNDMDMQLEEFQPIEPGKVKMYACGPTVYNYIHVGNARPIVIFDVLRRYLEYRGYEVTFVQNFTDVDDKIIKKAIEEGVEASVISERYIAECKKLLYNNKSFLGIMSLAGKTSELRWLRHNMPAENSGAVT